MTWKDCQCLIIDDLSRLTDGNVSVKIALSRLITNASFKITFWFRIGTYLQHKGGLWKLLYAIVLVYHKHHMYKTGIQLPIGTQVGGGLTFTHFSCIIIHYAAVIGKNCTIFQGVTIGSTRGKGHAPIIGDNVILFAGAKIVSSVTVGDNVVVGSNAVVLKDIPSGSVAVGVPAKVVNYNADQIIKAYVK